MTASQSSRHIDIDLHCLRRCARLLPAQFFRMSPRRGPSSPCAYPSCGSAHCRTRARFGLRCCVFVYISLLPSILIDSQGIHAGKEPPACMAKLVMLRNDVRSDFYIPLSIVSALEFQTANPRRLYFHLHYIRSFQTTESIRYPLKITVIRQLPAVAHTLSRKSHRDNVHKCHIASQNLWKRRH